MTWRPWSRACLLLYQTASCSHFTSQVLVYQPYRAPASTLAQASGQQHICCCAQYQAAAFLYHRYGCINPSSPLHWPYLNLLVKSIFAAVPNGQLQPFHIPGDTVTKQQTAKLLQVGPGG